MHDKRSSLHSGLGRVCFLRRLSWPEDLPKSTYGSGNIGFVSLPATHANSHDSPATPSAASRKCFAGTSDGRNHLVCPAVIFLFRSSRPQTREPNHTLVNHGLGENLRSWQGANLRNKR